MASTESSTNRPVRLIIDVDNKPELPKRFRMSTTPPKGDEESLRKLDLTGLSGLRISGSGMFSQRGLQAMKREIGEKPMIVVDLRQESHGFVNGMAVSWYGTENGENKRLPAEEVLRIERSLLEELDRSPSIVFDWMEGKSVNLGRPLTEPKIVQTEEALVRSEDVGYRRFFVTDHHRPLDEVVDEFMRWLQTLPHNVWLHFHCRGGVGRTSTFMIMVDMMRHAGEVGFEQIMERHVRIGGKDFDAPAKEAYKVAPAVERMDFIRTFYDYCTANKANGFRKTWSAWIAEQAKGDQAG